MPLYATYQELNEATILIWHVTETEKELNAGINLASFSVERLACMKSESHRRAYLSIRHLLINLGLQDADLIYDNQGKPHLRDGRYISISHSYDMTGVILGNVPVGIDIEKNRDKIKLIASRFVGSEASFINPKTSSTSSLTSVWGAKECLYKIMGKSGMSFSADFHIHKFIESDRQFIGHIKTENSPNFYRFLQYQLRGFTLVYALPR